MAGKKKTATVNKPSAEKVKVNQKQLTNDPVNLSDGEKSKKFYRELPKIALLIVLYSFQGVPLGLFMVTVPVLFKKFLTYSEIGVIMMCTLPFSFKVLWSPFVEFYHFKSIGKRKSWIIPTQLIMCVVLTYLREHLETLLIAKEVHEVSMLLTFFVFIITCQDIAVDAWAVEMLHPCNSTYGSSAQSIGHRLGMFISTSVFISLNSIQFCQKWIYGGEANADMPDQLVAPILTLSNFLGYYIVFQLAVTVFITFFLAEIDPILEAELKEIAQWKKLEAQKKEGGSAQGNDGDESEEEEENPDLYHTFAIFYDIVRNRNLQVWMLFMFCCKAGCAINNNAGEVYLTNDLGFPKEDISIVKVVITPFSILIAIISGYLTGSEPFRFLSYAAIAGLLIANYNVLYLLQTFPATIDEYTKWTYVHVGVMAIVGDLVSSFEFVSCYAIIMSITDKRVSGIHVTMLAALYNMSEFSHKFYIFQLIDKFGIFKPQIVLGSLSFGLALALRTRFVALQDLPREAWHVSDSVLQRSKKIEEVSKDKQVKSKK